MQVEYVLDGMVSLSQFFEHAVLQTAAGKTENVGAFFEGFRVGKYVIDRKNVAIMDILPEWFLRFFSELYLIIRF
jgi:hypothetical protein